LIATNQLTTRADVSSLLWTVAKLQSRAPGNRTRWQRGAHAAGSLLLLLLLPRRMVLSELSRLPSVVSHP
jgi:hypothetical protein